MTDVSELLKLIPVDDIAKSLGVDSATAKDGITAALPAILGGLGANAQDSAGAASLQKALASKDGTLLDGGVDVGAIDTADGEKIVNNVFGEKKNDVIAALGGTSGSQDAGLVSKLMPMLAPIVMAYLAKKMMSGGAKSGAQAAPGGGIEDVLGGLLGGGGGKGGGLGGILGQLGGSAGSQGGLTDLLGGLLGGGKR